MEKFRIYLIFLEVIVYQAVALTAQEQVVQAAAPFTAVAFTAQEQVAQAAAPNLAAAAEARVQDWSAKANVGQTLSAAEISVGREIINKLDDLMLSPLSRRPGESQEYTYNMDLQLIIDSSGSIGASEFSKGKTAMKTLVNYVDWRCPISFSGSQVGLIEFSTPHQTHVEFNMGHYTSRWSVNNAIQNVGYDSGYSTATANALRLAKTEFSQNGRIGNVKVAWILTDGQSNTGGNPRQPASELKNMGVTVCAVAIGNYVNMNEINDIASSGCVYRASSFSRYDKIMEFAAAERMEFAAPERRGSMQQSPVLDPFFFHGIQF